MNQFNAEVHRGDLSQESEQRCRWLSRVTRTVALPPENQSNGS